MRRFWRLFIGGAIPGWLVFWWTMLSHGSTAQFGLWLASGVVLFFDKHPWVAGFIGLAWLALVVVWPDLKKRAPWLRLPMSFHEQVDTQFRAVWESLGKALELQNQMADNQKTAAEAHSKIADILSDRIGALERDQTKAADLRKITEALGKRLDSAEANIKPGLEVSMYMPAVRADIANLTERIKALETARGN